jgi:hypothetical protein
MQTLKTFWAKIVPTTSASTTDEAAVNSLRFMAVSLLIIGLVTSWLGIAPFTFSMLAKIVPMWAAYVLTVAICVLLSMLIDMPLGVFVPSFFGKMSAIFTEQYTHAALLKALSVFAISLALTLLTMNLSKSGGAMTAKMLFEGERPTEHGTNAAKMDSVKNAAAATIRKSFEKEMTAAKEADSKTMAEAKQKTVTAHYNAKAEFPKYETHDYHRNGYRKKIAAARIDSTALANSAAKVAAVEGRINAALYSSAAAFESDNAAAQSQLKQKWADYDHKISVANTLLRDLGYYATPLFWLITGLAVLMGVKEKGKVKKVVSTPTLDKDGIVVEEIEVEEVGVRSKHEIHRDNLAKVKDIKQHWRQHFDRLQGAIDKGSETNTPAKNILKMYSDIRDIGEDFYDTFVKQATAHYPSLAEIEVLIKYRDNVTN